MYQGYLAVNNIHSAMQVMPYLAENSSRLITYQRSSPWVLPRPQIAYPEFMKWIFRNIPLFMLLHRWFLYMVVRKKYCARIQDFYAYLITLYNIERNYLYRFWIS
jgi:hypothetical protein